VIPIGKTRWQATLWAAHPAIRAALLKVMGSGITYIA